MVKCSTLFPVFLQNQGFVSQYLIAAVSLQIGSARDCFANMSVRSAEAGRAPEGVRTSSLRHAACQRTGDGRAQIPWRVEGNHCPS